MNLMAKEDNAFRHSPRQVASIAMDLEFIRLIEPRANARVISGRDAAPRPRDRAALSVDPF
jgi:hypothetical protein